MKNVGVFLLHNAFFSALSMKFPSKRENTYAKQVDCLNPGDLCLDLRDIWGKQADYTGVIRVFLICQTPGYGEKLHQYLVHD